MSRPSIDVVVPVFNGEKYIAGALASILAQTYAPQRIIVVNDGSTDRTESIVLEISAKAEVEVRQLKIPNSGLSAARNHGLKAASSDYIAFLDADDLWLPDKLSEQVKVFENSPDRELGVVYCDYAAIDENGGEASGVAVLHPRLRGEVFEKLLNGNLISGSCSAALVRRECFAAAGYFDEALSAVEDWDMWLRIAKTFGFDYSDRALVKIRVHRDSMQRNKTHMFVNELLFFDKWACYFDSPMRASWAKSLAYRIVDELPRLDYYRAAKARLSAPARRKLFSACFGSMPLYITAAACYIWAKRAFRKAFWRSGL